ncbi:MAG: hypothetical protein ACRD3H_14315 [Terriglobales bacterium]
MVQTGPVEVCPVEVCPYQYRVYGVTLGSDVPLALPAEGCGDLARISLRSAPASFFRAARRPLLAARDSRSWYQFRRLPDHSSYVRWDGVGEFLVSAHGHQICARRFDEASRESFEVYLLGQALSFALVKCRLEPLHATSVVVNGEAVAFLGESGFGKSTLAACFLAAGYAILTDDVLILRKDGKKDGGFFYAYPGPPRIKLYPQLVRRFLGSASAGVAMNSASQKLVLPLGAARVSPGPIPLKALYALEAPRPSPRRQPIRIVSLTSRESFLELVKNTFNYRIVNPDRLQRQFKQTAQVVETMAVKRVSYPRILARIAAVRDEILADLAASSRRAACGD